jgi:isopentenyl-diphosphate delta-isomerase
MSFMGREINAPLMLTGMTGGTERAAMINRHLALVCQSLNIPFGLGSQRIMTHSASRKKLATVTKSFKVKRFAPDVFLVANIGVNQLRDLGEDQVVSLYEEVEADAIAIHLNPAMELIQPGSEADSDFTRGYEVIESLCKRLDHVIVKECGCGLSKRVVQRLEQMGVACVDVSGVGGTSWVKLEAKRAEQERGYSREARLGMLLADWGVPTAAATLLAAPIPIKVVASGGISNALEATKALALGADVVGLARPALQAFLEGYEQAGQDPEVGQARAQDFLEEMIYGIRVITALTGARSPRQLRDLPHVIGPKLRAWVEQT